MNTMKEVADQLAQEYASLDDGFDTTASQYEALSRYRESKTSEKKLMDIGQFTLNCLRGVCEDKKCDGCENEGNE
jgi:hypothetical protein